LSFVIAAGELKGLFYGSEIVFGAVFANLCFELTIKLIDRIVGRRRRGRKYGGIGDLGRFGGH
jgi:hypothetical protein